MKNTFLLVLLSLLAPVASAQLSVGSTATFFVGTGGTLSVNGALSNAGTFTNQGHVYLRGNLSNTGTLASTAGNWTFDGTTAQSLSSSATLVVNNLTVANTAAGIALTLSTPVTVGGTLTLTDGVVQANSPNRLYLSNSAASALVAGTGNANFANSFLTGTLRRALAPGVATYVFPLGSATPALRRVNVLTNNLTGVGYLDGTFGAKAGTDAGLSVSEGNTTYTAVNDAGVWTLTPNAAPTGGNYGVQLYVAGFAGLIDNQFAPLRRPDASGNGADWQAPAGSAIPALSQPGRTVGSGYAERTGLTGFSQFGIGQTAQALPLDLISFRGYVLPDGHRLEWVTDRERDVSHFDLERSSDARTFESLGRTLARNAGSRQTYTRLDAQPLPGIGYYRLRMVDLDGSARFSRVLSLSHDDATPYVRLFPNPVADDQLTLEYTTGRDAQPVTIRLLSPNGYEVLRQNATFQRGTTAYRLSVAPLPGGTYLLDVTDGKGTQLFRQHVVKP